MCFFLFLFNIWQVSVYASIPKRNEIDLNAKVPHIITHSTAEQNAREMHEPLLLCKHLSEYIQRTFHFNFKQKYKGKTYITNILLHTKWNYIAFWNDSCGCVCVHLMQRMYKAARQVIKTKWKQNFATAIQMPCIYTAHIYLHGAVYNNKNGLVIQFSMKILVKLYVTVE